MYYSLKRKDNENWKKEVSYLSHCCYWLFRSVNWKPRTGTWGQTPSLLCHYWLAGIVIQARPPLWCECTSAYLYFKWSRQLDFRLLYMQNISKKDYAGDHSWVLLAISLVKQKSKSILKNLLMGNLDVYARDKLNAWIKMK